MRKANSKTKLMLLSNIAYTKAPYNTRVA